MDNQIDKIGIFQTAAGNAALELLHDGIEKAVQHAQDASTALKASTITLKVKITPEQDRTELQYEVGSTISLAPRPPFKRTVFAEKIEGETDEVRISEFDPKQMSLPGIRDEVPAKALRHSR
jgi:hypothetical protein